MYRQITAEVLDALRSIVYDIPEKLQSDRFKASLSISLPLVIDITLRQYSEEDERGPGLALEYGMWHRPDKYGHA